MNEPLFLFNGLKTVIYPVRDLEAAKAWYMDLLGVTPHVDEKNYVGFQIGDSEMGLDPNGFAEGMIGPETYWRVASIEEASTELLEHGAQQIGETQTMDSVKLAKFKDKDGNILGIITYI
jgi:predicted enzyme related to lactoylglutathione lyase